MKKIIKKWWFWVIVACVVILLYILVSNYTENKKVEDTFKNIGKSASNFVAGSENTKSHINEFSYNYSTGKVEYKPEKITLEMYNRIKKEMTIDEVISILGDYDNKLDGENTYLVEWGSMDAPKNNGYWIQIVFNKDEKVLNTSQLGLK